VRASRVIAEDRKSTYRTAHKAHQPSSSFNHRRFLLPPPPRLAAPRRQAARPRPTGIRDPALPNPVRVVTPTAGHQSTAGPTPPGRWRYRTASPPPPTESPPVLRVPPTSSFLWSRDHWSPLPLDPEPRNSNPKPPPSAPAHLPPLRRGPSRWRRLLQSPQRQRGGKKKVVIVRSTMAARISNSGSLCTLLPFGIYVGFAVGMAGWPRPFLAQFGPIFRVRAPCVIAD
jgi:hypothetical protein